MTYNKSENNDLIQDEKGMLIFEYEQVVSLIRHYDSQLHNITNFGLTLVFTMIFVSLYLYDKSPFTSGLMMLLAFYITGIIGYLSRRSARYLRGLAKYSSNLNSKLKVKLSEEIRKIRKEQFNDWEDMVFNPKTLRYIKYAFLLTGYYLILTDSKDFLNNNLIYFLIPSKFVTILLALFFTLATYLVLRIIITKVIKNF